MCLSLDRACYQCAFVSTGLVFNVSYVDRACYQCTLCRQGLLSMYLMWTGLVINVPLSRQGLLSMCLCLDRACYQCAFVSAGLVINVPLSRQGLLSMCLCLRLRMRWWTGWWLSSEESYLMRVFLCQISFQRARGWSKPEEHLTFNLSRTL